MKAAILGIGTELTDGQIVNKNGSWISKKLKDLGLTTSVHLVVPDEASLIREGLDFCRNQADLLFVTGGLGPTSDDFTRNIISEWANAPLMYDEKSWVHLNERLTSRGYTVKEIQRQQCYFPQGAKVLINSEGTANAFYLEVFNKKVFVLPGPPREIEAIWNSSVASWLIENTKNLDPYLTQTWETIGVGESDIALLVENILQKAKKKNFQVGYRVHMPYVEVKFSYLKSDENKLQVVIDKITEALRTHTVARDNEDVLSYIAAKLESFNSLSIEDAVTGSFLVNRMVPGLRKFMSAKKWNFSNTILQENFADIHLRLTPVDKWTCEASLESATHKARMLITSPYKLPTMQERTLQYFAEMALICWLKEL
ncbi:MAG: competence/damage-inducible protein A [Pseudobdellovibrionaceae bacterium]